MPALAPHIAVRIDELHVHKVSVRVTFFALRGNGTTIDVDGGRVATGKRVHLKWPKHAKLKQGRYRVILHATGPHNLQLARGAHASGRTTLTVTKPKPRPKPTPAPTTTTTTAPTAAPDPRRDVPGRRPLLVRRRVRRAAQGLHPPGPGHPGRARHAGRRAAGRVDRHDRLPGPARRATTWSRTPPTATRSSSPTAPTRASR